MLVGRAFGDCESLTTVHIPWNVDTSLTTYSPFDGCTNLKNITFGTGIIKIPSSLFRNCASITAIFIPATVEEFGNNVFNGCTNLTIYGVAGSSAEIYAIEKAIPFVAGTIPSATSMEATSVEHAAASGTVGEFTESFSGLRANEHYTFVALKTVEAEDVFGSENLLFITDVMTDANGCAEVRYIPDEAYSGAVTMMLRTSRDIHGTLTERSSQASFPKAISSCILVASTFLIASLRK